jgi:hypothetical protein
MGLATSEIPDHGGQLLWLWPWLPPLGLWGQNHLLDRARLHHRTRHRAAERIRHTRRISHTCESVAIPPVGQTATAPTPLQWSITSRDLSNGANPPLPGTPCTATNAALPAGPPCWRGRALRAVFAGLGGDGWLETTSPTRPYSGRTQPPAVAPSRSGKHATPEQINGHPDDSGQRQSVSNYVPDIDVSSLFK